VGIQGKDLLGSTQKNRAIKCVVHAITRTRVF
jgi:hypothetical protein